jgi:hypothetical protein
MFIPTLFFLLVVLWAYGNISLFVYYFFIRGEKKLTIEEFRQDTVIQSFINQAFIGKYGAFLLGLYIIGAAMGIYSL